MYTKVVATLVTLRDSSLRIVKRWFPQETEVLQFGTVLRLNGGDSMRGLDFVNHEREASFVRVCPHSVDYFLQSNTKCLSIINIVTRTGITSI